ncbi:unnamed protein product [Closterium sp. Yama58-4]|nr:unnamed protein product [Closterium sp. Yama58-4]
MAGRVDFSNWSPNRKLCEAEAGGLVAEWTEEEVKAAFKSLARNKSPGADGLPKELFEEHWDVLGNSFMALVKDFTATAELPDEEKEAVTILLHKKGDRSQLNNYRPITLLNFSYKILAKVLADRIKRVLHLVISPEQYGFIPGRRLADAVALVADIIDAAKNGNKDWYLLLVDFQKAFDSVSRYFLFNTLRDMGFPSRFMAWIEGLHAHTTTKLLVNDWTGRGIEVVSGVRQGCPLAPYLFLCAVEPLAQEVERRQLGLSLEGHRLSYLGYADDTTLRLQGEEQITQAEGILEEFEKMSGLATNKGKSVILPLGANLEKEPMGSFKWAEPDEAERLLGVWVTPNGSGLPTWEKALEEIAKRLTKWKQKYLTTKARAAVANSYIHPVMAFQAQVYPPPAEVWKELEELIHNFVSRNKATAEKVFTLWNKDLLYTKHRDGGLGVQDPSVILTCLSARRVGLLLTEVNVLKRDLMMSAADLPMGVGSFVAHNNLLKNWDGRSQRWKQTCKSFMSSPLCSLPELTTREEVARERLVFNRRILVGVTAPVGGQQAAENLWEVTLGDLVDMEQGTQPVLKSMETLLLELGGKGPARLALKAFAAAPNNWKALLLDLRGSPADSTPPEGRLLQLPIFENGQVVSQRQMRKLVKKRRKAGRGGAFHAAVLEEQKMLSRIRVADDKKWTWTKQFESIWSNPRTVFNPP